MLIGMCALFFVSGLAQTGSVRRPENSRYRSGRSHADFVQKSRNFSQYPFFTPSSKKNYPHPLLRPDGVDMPRYKGLNPDGTGDGIQSYCECSSPTDYFESQPAWEHSIADRETPGDASAMGSTVLPDGSIVTTGYAIRSGHLCDITTLCYDPDGHVKWQVFYDGPLGADDVGLDVIPGLNGKIYVSGLSLGASGLYEILLICYRTDGSREWVFRDTGRSGPAYNWESHTMMQGQDGQIRILFNAQKDRCDYVQLIIVTEDGEKAAEYALIDENGFRMDLKDEVLDLEDNLVVACFRSMYSYGFDETEEEWANDILIQKIDAKGNGLWEYEIISSAYANMDVSGIIADSSGNLYFSGYHVPCCENEFSSHVFLKKLNPDGALNWSQTVLDDSVRQDWVTGLCLLPDDQILLLTESPWERRFSEGLDLFKFNSGGERLSRVTADIARDTYLPQIDNEQNIILSAWNRVLKLTPKGEILWERAEVLSDFYTFPINNLTLDPTNRIVLSGLAMEGEAGGWQSLFCTAVLDADGANLWHNLVESEHTAQGSAYDVIAADDGHLLVNGSNNTVRLTQKLDRAGHVIWSQEEVLEGGGDWLWSDDQIKLDQYGNVYSLMNNRYLFKYTPSGREVWNIDLEKRMQDLGSELFIRSFIVSYFDVDASGNATLCGSLYHEVLMDNEFYFNEDGFVLCLDQAGKTCWSHRFDSGFETTGTKDRQYYEFAFDYLYAMSIGSGGSVFVASRSATQSQPVKNHITRFNAQGRILWNKNLRDLGMYEPETICADQHNNLVVAGTVLSEQGIQDIMNLKFGSDGKVLWKRTETLPGWVRPQSVTISEQGDIQWFGNVGEQMPNSGGQTRCSGYLIQYNSRGFKQWEKKLPDVCAHQTGQDPAGNFYVWKFYGRTPYVLGYNSIGEEIFRTEYSDPVAGSILFNSLTVDRFGGVTVAASVRGFNSVNWSTFRVLHFNPNFDPSIMSSPGLSVSQNHPNPFSRSTTIRISLTEPSDVRLTVYNSLGQEVQRQEIKEQSAGEYEYTLQVQGLANGVYLYQVEAGEEVETRKMVLVR